MNAAASDQVAAFLDYLRQVRQYSAHTIAAYRRDLLRFTEFCQQRDIASLADVQGGDVRLYASQLHRQGKQGRSIQRGLSAVRSLFNYLARQGEVSQNPANGIQAPKQKKRLPKALDADQITHFLNSPAGDADIELRDAAIAELFYSSGLRLSELAALDLGDIDAQEGLVTVTGKGRKTRTIPVGDVALNAIAAWRKVRPAIDDPALFLSRRGQRISTRSIQDRLRRRGREAGLHQDIHPHMLRHSFASHMLESSGDLRAVQELLGHANISTTQVYTHLDFQHLAKVYDQAHPRARRSDDMTGTDTDDGTSDS
ncbi:MAG: tyrosine recombinase XerC [Pseudomonadota bacterium]